MCEKSCKNILDDIWKNENNIIWSSKIPAPTYDEICNAKKSLLNYDNLDIKSTSNIKEN